MGNTRFAQGRILRHLILAGGGHAHLFVLERLAREQLADLRVTLVNPDPWQYYSGMIPGWLAGYYRLDECRIDLRRLAARAGISFFQKRLGAVDPVSRSVTLDDGSILEYDLLSLDIGSETQLGELGDCAANLLSVKPLPEFQSRWQTLKREATKKPNLSIVVIGAGAAGVELACAIRQALPGGSVTLVAGEDGLLVDHNAGVRRRAAFAMQRLNISVRDLTAVSVTDTVSLADGQTIPADLVIAATGARAPGWLRATGLALDKEGYVLVDSFQRSLSHPEVFAAGDVCARSDLQLQRSGVHSVRAGPVLAHNLSGALNGSELRSFYPRGRTLYLLSTGDKRAIASWGRWSAEGRWVWHWKNAIDRRFVRRFCP